MKKPLIPKTEDNPIRIQLDHKTFITITKMSSLEVWRKRYPNAKVV